MGTYSKSSFGKIAGTVGESVGSHWRGIKVIRSLPTKSDKPASLAQLAVYARFALSAKQLSPIKDLLNIGFGDKKLKKLTGYNAAVKAFLAEAITGTYPNYGIDYSKIRMSKGSLEGAEFTSNFSNDINLTWRVDEINDISSFVDDKMMFVIFNETKKTYRLNTNYSRGDGDMSTAFSGTPGDVLHIWAFCVKRDGKSVSPSQYLGTVTIPLPVI